MVTKKASGKKGGATKKVGQKKIATRKLSGKKPTPKKVPNKHPVSRAVIVNECGGFSYQANGNMLTIQADEGASLDFEFNISGAECRSLVRCRIVNGQWEC